MKSFLAKSMNLHLIVAKLGFLFWSLFKCYKIQFLRYETEMKPIGLLYVTFQMILFKLHEGGPMDFVFRKSTELAKEKSVRLLISSRNDTGRPCPSPSCEFLWPDILFTFEYVLLHAALIGT